MAQLIRERRWHASQELTDLPGGGVRLRLRLNNLQELERWVLSWGTHASVIRPKRLCDQFHRAAMALVERCAESPE